MSIKDPRIAAALGVLIVGLHMAGLYSIETMTTFLGIIGLTSIAQLRALIESAGLKTYGTVIIGIATIATYAAGWISQEMVILGLSLVFPLAAASLFHGFAKEKRAIQSSAKPVGTGRPLS